MQFNQLHVCVIGPLPPPAGGMANQTAELCRLLRQEGAKVTLVATNAPYRPRWVGKLRAVRALFRLAPYLLALWREIGRADLVHLMANSGWSWHLFAAPALWIARLRRTPLVVNYRGGNAEPFFRRSWGVVRCSLRHAAACIVPSPFLAKIFASRQVAARIIPNTLDQSLFFPPEPVPTVAPAAPLIAITRNLEPIYGIDLALKALPLIQQRYPGARLVVAGSGPERPALEHLARELGIEAQVEFCGRLERSQVAELYRRAQLLLNPSRVDNSPNSIIEALGCGLPVVSTRAGGIPDLVHDGDTALLVEPESPAALAAAVIRLLDAPELYQQLRHNGLCFAQQFHWPQLRTALLEVYRQAAEAPL